MTNIVVIPARGGSKGIPGKNIKCLDGKPLIHYTVDAAKKVFKDSEIIVSTDDESIRNCVEEKGLKVPFLRPAYLATDSVGTYEVLLHAVEYYESLNGPIDILVLLQPTSPFRTSEHIEEALRIFHAEENIDLVVSVCESKTNPYYNLFEENEKGYLELSKEGDYIRRQDCPKVWEYNGAIYVINVGSLKKNPLHKFERIKKYEMDDFSSLDIDTPLDWNIAEQYISQLKNKN